MPMSCLETDLRTIFGSSDFGELSGSVTWKGQVIESGIFDDEDVQIELGEGVGEIAHQASFTGASADFPGIADGDVVTVSGDNFTVKNWIDDGTGVITIMLERK